MAMIIDANNLRVNRSICPCGWSLGRSDEQIEREPVSPCFSCECNVRAANNPTVDEIHWMAIAYGSGVME